MLAREKLLEGEALASDAAPLCDLVLNLMAAKLPIHAMRDPTRGGVAAALNEIARQSKVSIELDETLIPVRPAVAAACEALGIDPLHVANEGKMLIFVAPEAAYQALNIIRASRYGQEAQIIGAVQPAPPGRVQLKTQIGTTRLLDPPSGELLPRIC